MNRSAAVLLGIGLGFGAFLTIRAARAPRPRLINLKTEDLDYQDLAAEEVVSQHLVDLNDADRAQLENLALNPESIERIIEGRPYRSKLELVSRMVLSEAEYASIREKIGVSKGREPVKIA